MTKLLSGKVPFLFPYIIILLFCLPIFYRILTPGFFPMHDDFHIIRTFEMDKCINDGQIPCRWVPDMGFGYGYPEFNYYAPLPYYFMEMFHLFGASYIDSVKILIVSMTIAGAIGMYWLSLAVWKNRISGLLSSFLITYLPYRAVDIYVRGALPEVAALAITPFVFLFAKQMIEGKKRSVTFFSLSLALLLVTHTLSIILMVPFLLIWILFFLVQEKQKLGKIYWIGLGFSLAIGLSAFFVLPAYFEKNYVHIETLTAGYFNYLAHFVSIKQLLFSTHWGYGFSESGAMDDISLSVGIIQWIVAVCGLIGAYFYERKRNLILVGFFLISGIFALFLTHQRSSFIWNTFSTLQFVQFPWRFLIVSGFFFCLACGAITLFSNKIVRIIVVAIVVISTVWLYGNIFAPKEILHTTDSQKLSGEEWTKAITASIYDYLPINAEKAPDSEASAPQFIDGAGDVLNVQKGTNHQEWEVNVTSDNAQIELPIYYFPNWQVKVNGVATPFNYHNQRGLIRVQLEKGEQQLSLKLEDTLLRKVSNIISILSLGLLVFFLI